MPRFLFVEVLVHFDNRVVTGEEGFRVRFSGVSWILGFRLNLGNLGNYFG
jgi:hypothetical protein